MKSRGMQPLEIFAEVARRSQIVRNHHLGQPQPLLQVLQEIEDLRSNGDIESRDRFVQSDELWIGHQGARICNATHLFNQLLIPP
jgi:hypothetical protein